MADAQLAEVLRISAGSMLVPSQDSCNEPPRLRKRHGEGAGKNGKAKEGRHPMGRCLVDRMRPLYHDVTTVVFTCP